MYLHQVHNLVYQLRAGVATIQQSHQGAPAHQAPNLDDTESLQPQILKAFIRSPLATHNEVNPRNSKAILVYNEANFQINFAKPRQVESSSVESHAKYCGRIPIPALWTLPNWRCCLKSTTS
ncbi:hypothetical protein VP01_2529g1 [Puccinia sorghi]|uniref:Uncharacterized protein n=1 Tax=Puccinia sorghi TaxID=27349 RepID=A0A0L6V785_9BASI|nr:hypothetical protein VP01_2529g1 [Puccinia sorghi]